MADAIPTPDEVHEKLVEALTDYLAVSTGRTSLRAMDYVVSVAGVDLAAADGRTYYATAYTGPPHSRLGLVEILGNDIEESAFPDET